MTKQSKLILAAVIGVVVLGFIGGLLVDRRVGDEMNIGDLGALFEAQPELMPGMELPVLGEMPELEGLVAWINSPELTKEDLEGKVVLVDFWTYSCINCIRTYPYLKSWWGKYQDDDFILLGIHTPEFAFEEKLENVQKAVEDNDLTFPIALDNDYKTWRNFNNRFWPAKYLFDKDGQLRYTHFGEGDYEETELAIQQLLNVDEELSDEDAGVDFRNVNSSETYLGYARMERLVSPEQVVPEQVTRFTSPDDLAVNTWSFTGDWFAGKEYSESRSPASIRFRFDAAAVNIVAEADAPQTLRVLLDGEPIPETLRGAHIDVDAEGNTTVTIQEATLYELIKGEPGEHTIEIFTPESGTKLYTFTFG